MATGEIAAVLGAADNAGTEADWPQASTRTATSAGSAFAITAGKLVDVSTASMTEAS
jgi:hypothetical protein